MSAPRPAPSFEAIERHVEIKLRDQARATKAVHSSWTVETLLLDILKTFYCAPDGSLPSGLPFPIKKITSLYNFALRQSRLMARILAAVATRPVVTVSDLEEEICLTEGVAQFAQLGFGRSLTAFPLIQQYFRVTEAFSVRRVRAQDFLHFLIVDPEARTLLESGADAGDLVRGFAKRVGVNHIRDLGIHIQNIAWLLAIVRTEAARACGELQREVDANTDTSDVCTAVASQVRDVLSKILSDNGTDSDEDEQKKLFPTQIRIALSTLPLPAAGMFPKSWICGSGESSELLLQLGTAAPVPIGALPASVSRVHNEPSAPPVIRIVATASKTSRQRRIQTAATTFEDVDLHEIHAGPSPLASWTAAEWRRRSIRHRLRWCATEEDLDAVRRCITVLSTTASQHDSESVECAVSRGDMRKLSDCLSVPLNELSSSVVAEIELALQDCEADGALRRKCHPYIQEYHRAIASSNLVRSEDVAMKLLNVLELASPFQATGSVSADLSIASILMLPVQWGTRIVEMTLEECISLRQPVCVLSGDGTINLFPFCDVAAGCSAHLVAIDASTLFRGSAVKTARMATVALLGHGLKRTIPFPASDNSIFAQAVLESTRLTAFSNPDTAKKTLEGLLALGNQLWGSVAGSEPLLACQLLCETRWIPMPPDEALPETATLDMTTTSSKGQFSLAAPADVLDANPKMLRLFQNVGVFLPPFARDDDGKPCPLSPAWLSALRVNTKPTAWLAARILSSVRKGTVLSRGQVIRIYTFLSECSKDDVIAAVKAYPSCILIPSPCSRPDDETIEIASVVSSCQVCWDRVSASDDEQALFHRSLCQFYDDSLKSLFVETLCVSECPSLNSWVSSMIWNRCNRRSISSSVFTALRVLTIRCFRHEVSRLHKLSLDVTSCSIPKHEPLFPTPFGWRAVQDRIIFVGQELSQSDVCYVSKQTGVVAPHKRPICFFVIGERLDFSLQKLLLTLGLLDFNSVTDTLVTFEQINLEASSEFHRKICVAAPFVQQMLRGEFPTYYSLIGQSVSAALSKITVLVCRNPFLLHRVEPRRSDEIEFHVRKSVPLFWDRKQLTLCCTDAELAPHVPADVLAEVFCPQYFSDVFEYVKTLLQVLFRTKTNNPKHELKLNQIDVDPSSIPAEEMWGVSSPWNDRYRQNYPPGTDALDGAPPPLANTRNQFASKSSLSMVLPAGEEWSSLEFAKDHIVAAGIMKSRVRGREDNEDSSESEEDSGRVRGARGGRRAARVETSSTGSAAALPNSTMILRDADQRGYSISAEKFVYDSLKSMYASDPQVEVRWLNEQAEVGSPFDIAVLRRLKDASEPITEKFVEVKSTNTKDRQDFEMSLRELLFAAKYGRKYSVFRVFRASESNLARMTMIEVVDPVERWQRGGLTMTGQVKVVIV